MKRIGHPHRHVVGARDPDVNEVAALMLPAFSRWVSPK